MTGETSVTRFIQAVRTLPGAEEEWSDGARFPPLQIVPAEQAVAASMIVVTKLDTILRSLGEGAFPSHALILGQYGLMAPGVSAFLPRIKLNAPAYFVGDLDPLDIAAWWVCSEACGGAMEFAGVGDAQLAQLRMAGHSPEAVFRSFGINMSEFECAAWRLLQQCYPGINGIVGHECSSYLDLGTKLEVDAFLMGALGEDGKTILRKTLLGCGTS